MLFHRWTGRIRRTRRLNDKNDQMWTWRWPLGFLFIVYIHTCVHMTITVFVVRSFIISKTLQSIQYCRWTRFVFFLFLVNFVAFIIFFFILIFSVSFSFASVHFSVCTFQRSFHVHRITYVFICCDILYIHRELLECVLFGFIFVSPIHRVTWLEDRICVVGDFEFAVNVTTHCNL